MLTIPESVLFDYFRSNGLIAEARNSDQNAWDKVLEHSSYTPVSYTRSSLDYQLAYQLDSSLEWKDLSLILYWDGAPVGVWPLFLHTLNGKNILNTLAQSIIPPLFVKTLGRNSRKKLLKASVDTLIQLARDLNMSLLTCEDGFINEEGLSEWYMEWIRRGARSTVSHDLYLDLRPSFADIRSTFRKSYKPLISRGLRDWDVRSLETHDKKVWEAFKQLHIRVAGRQTRSDNTWDKQYEEISSGSSLLVYLLDNNGLLEGGGLFTTTRDEGLYAVAAYNRDLFDKPLGHVVQYRAIEIMKQRGIRWYRLGLRPSQNDRKPASAKEISIADFKQGFASHVMARYQLEFEIPNVTTE